MTTRLDIWQQGYFWCFLGYLGLVSRYSCLYQSVHILASSLLQLGGLTFISVPLLYWSHHSCFNSSNFITLVSSVLWNVAGIFSICCSSATIAIWWWQKFLKMQYNWCEYLVVSFLLIVVSCMCMVYWTSYLGSRHQPSNSRNRFLSYFFVNLLIDVLDVNLSFTCTEWKHRVIVN